MEFQKRLERAIERGKRAGDARARAEAEQAVTEKELQRLHSQYRLELSERIERCLKPLADRFPGFRFETIVGTYENGLVFVLEDEEKIQKIRERYPQFKDVRFGANDNPALVFFRVNGIS